MLRPGTLRYAYQRNRRNVYNKLFTKILDSSIWLEPDQHRLVWITLIAAMDRYGVTQFACAENLAARARVSLEAAESAIKAFESPDPHDPTQEFEGRRIERIPGGWLVLNAEKYREMVTASVASEKSRERMRKFREKNRVTKSDATLRTVTPSVSDAGAFLKKATDVADRREEAKALWPRVLAAVQSNDLQKSFPADGDVYRAISKIGGWRRLGLKNRDLRGQSEQEFLNAYAELPPCH